MNENNMIRGLVGKTCEIDTEENYYEAVVKNVEGDWLELEEDGETVYVNLRHVFEIRPVVESSSEKPKGFFKRKKDEL